MKDHCGEHSCDEEDEIPLVGASDSQEAVNKVVHPYPSVTSFPIS